MKLKMGVIGNEASGKLGASVVFVPQAYGQIVRERVIPANPKTAFQTAQRGQFAQYSQAWSATLTEAQRNGWAAYGDKLPEKASRWKDKTFARRGQLAFIEANINSVSAGLIAPGGLVAIAPAGYTVVESEIGSFAPTADVSSTSLTMSASADSVMTPVLVYATAPLSAGRSKLPQSALRLIGKIEGGDPFNTNVWALYVARFGVAPTAGQKVGVKVAQISEAGYLVVESEKLITVVA